MIIASIVGGLILLGLAFGGGAIVGYVVGTYHVGRMAVQEYGGPGYPGFQGGQGPGWQGGPLHRHRGQQKEQEQQQDEPVPTPSPSPSS